MQVINLDHISANPLLPEVQEAMIEAIKRNYGNPSSQHKIGDQAAEALDKAREQVANLINCADPKEVVFTSCGTESVNLAIKGVAFGNANKGKHIVTSNIEHNAVLRSLRRLKMMDYHVTSIPVDEYGRVNPAHVAKAIRDDIGTEVALQLKEVLDRVPGTYLDAIPDAETVRAWKRANKDVLLITPEPFRWYFPNTEIAIVEVTDGPRRGEFLFSAETVSRAEEFYKTMEDLPYRPGATEGFYTFFISTPGYLVPDAHPLTRWIDALPPALPTALIEDLRHLEAAGPAPASVQDAIFEEARKRLSAPSVAGRIGPRRWAWASTGGAPPAWRSPPTPWARWGAPPSSPSRRADPSPTRSTPPPRFPSRPRAWGC